MENVGNKLKKHFPNMIFDEPLGKYSTFQIGGPADFFYKLKNKNELPAIIRFCRTNNIHYFIFGSGSNILFDDRGFRGMVIKIETKEIKVIGTTIVADSGVPVSTLLNESLKHSLTGLERWIGLPGTVGGAVRGNAGCNGLETKDVLLKATIIDTETGRIKEAGSLYFNFSYRDCKLKKTGEIVLDATFKLQKSSKSPADQKKIMQGLNRRRLQKQPFGLTTGSFFKNPSPDKPAGMLIDQAGLKGKTIGKAQISAKHGNFFLNIGGASSKDIIGLAQLARRKVKAKFGIELEEEVQIVGKNKLIKLAKDNAP
ncbi:UDP-N-acetylmuramate dehydrogenase [Candidatus Peregrinibacteria bacterium]|nr:UDP-N-acetylmuramate dehydrogenase [Candidatus Peregrinibacteria bacterium]